MIPTVTHDIRALPLELVDDPTIAMRDSFDDVKFVELKDSLVQNGQRVPIIVRPRGDRFEIVAGHRRTEALRQLGAATVNADVQDLTDDIAEAVKVIENDDREQVNVADSAIYLARLFVEKCNNDVDTLCAYVKRSARYVDDRLRLFYGDPEIFAALRDRKIGKGVALELNQIHDIGYRRLRLDNAVQFGMTEAAAREHRKQDNRAIEMGAQQLAGQAPLAELAAAPVEAHDVCYCCRKADHPERMRWIRVHEHCEFAHLEPLLAPIRAHYAALAAAAEPPQ